MKMRVTAGLLMATALVQGCVNRDLGSMDWDLRSNGSTAGAAQSVSARPSPDQNGVISYPGYQVAVARRGDTVASVAARVGVAPDQLARFNALSPNDAVRDGEILALPVRVASGQGAVIGGAMPGTGDIASGIEVEDIASVAIDRAAPGTAAASGTQVASSQTRASNLPFSTQGSGPAPVRYQVKRGETAFTIARQFNISAKALADWNGLPADLSVREGQYLIIPASSDLARIGATAETAPGQGSPTPVPPSASQPLPQETTVTRSQAASLGQGAPDLGASRTGASASAMAMPLSGKIIKAYDGKSSPGIDIAGSPGSSVKAASSGTVAVVTKDAASGGTIVIVKHDGGLLTVYAGLDSASVAKGDAVKRGTTLGSLRGSSLHFEVRQGQKAVDPLSYLQ